MARKSLPLLLGGIAGVLAPGVAMAQGQTFCFHADILGAPANFVIAAANRQAAQMATGAALAEIARLDRLLSNYRPDSELRRLNAASEMRVSPDLFAVLYMAEDLRARTGGAFDARMGAVEALWQGAKDEAPGAVQLRQAMERASQIPRLVSATYTVARPDGVQFSVDALAKGYIIDRALDAARLTAPTGILIDIGGDMRCHGNSGNQTHWPVGLPDPRSQFLNAPLVANVRLKDQAIATSGRGMRDRRIGNAVYSITLSPRTGQPVAANLSATVVAPTAATADGLATAMMVMRADHGLQLAAQTSGVEARITRADGAVLTTPGWAALEGGQAASHLPKSTPALQLAKADNLPVGPTGWVIDWALQVYYQAPPIDIAGHSEDYRSPYLAMWISDKQGKPLRTLALIGGDPEYQKDNHIWWSLYRDHAEHLTQLRSRPTALGGRYPTFWPGYDDNYNFLPPGEYLLNIETSRERGQHTFRAIPVKVGQAAFDIMVPPTADMGQIRIAFGKQP